MKSENDTKLSGSIGGMIKRAFAAAVMVLVVGGRVDAGNMIKDKNDILEVTVRPTTNEQPETGATVKLYKLNSLVEDFGTVDKGKVQFKLEKNQMYTIEVSKPGRITRQISISTHIADDVELRPIFRYDMQVELPEEVEGVDKYFFEFPIAVISYMPLEDKFDYNVEYTANIKAQQRKEIMKAQMSLTKY